MVKKFRRKLDEIDDIRARVIRYSSENASVVRISRVCNLPYTTVARWIKQHRTRGGCEDRRAGNCRKVDPIPAVVQEYLIETANLKQAIGKGISLRCKQVEHMFGFRMSPFRLRAFYLKHGIKYKRPDWVYRRQLDDSLALQRAIFCNSLWNQRRSVWYMDETSFNLSVRPGKTWTPLDKAFKIAKAEGFRSLTLYGASCYDEQPCQFKLYNRTDVDNTIDFLGLIRQMSKQEIVTVVLDQHSAHTSPHTKAFAAANKIHLMFTPTASCELNAQERVWTEVKRVYRNEVAKLPFQAQRYSTEQLTNLITTAVHEATLTPKMLTWNETAIREYMTDLSTQDYLLDRYH